MFVVIWFIKVSALQKYFKLFFLPGKKYGVNHGRMKKLKLGDHAEMQKRVSVNSRNTASNPANILSKCLMVGIISKFFEDKTFD